MDAVILAGGRGTRLLPLTISIPKALLPLGDRPIIDVILSQLATSGVRRVFVCVGHLAALIQAHLTERASEIEIEYVFEETPQGTAGGMRRHAEMHRVGTGGLPPPHPFSPRGYRAP